MTSGPWLTIVTVVKDDPSGLERTLRSLLGADPGSFEHLVIDSSAHRTATVELVSLLGLPSRVVWVEPAGVYAAMNTGLAEATGDFIHFLNAGDELAYPSVLADIRATLRASDAVWLEGPVEIVDAAGGTVITPPWDYDQVSEWAFARGRFPAHQGTVALEPDLHARAASSL